MLAALVNGVKGGKWFSLVDKVYSPKTLRKAWEAVRRNKGAAGIDKVKVAAFEAKLDDNVAKLSSDLKCGSYSPFPVKREEIPKAAGKTRPLGIPAVRDRVAQKAAQLMLEPIFESRFLDMSFGFRPGRGAKDALREVDRLIMEGYTHAVDADIQGYFDSIPHDKLMDRVKEVIADGRVLALLEGWLKQGIMTEAARWTPVSGTPQGVVIGPLLANIYLHPLDCEITGLGCKMVRYADDFVILTRGAVEADRALRRVTAWTERNGLTLHHDKTHVGNCMRRGQGFGFLGYRFEAGKRSVKKKSLAKIKEKVKELTPRNSGKSLEEMIDSLNRALKGWFNYFQESGKTVLSQLDSMVRRRLRARLLRMNKSKGFGKSKKCHERWPNSFFARKGLFTLSKAKAEAE
jgi:RNA-directed DNA polymerase